MDIQFWVWLIVIVITLIARANKKKPQPFDSGARPISGYQRQKLPACNLRRSIEGNPGRKVSKPKPARSVIPLNKLLPVSMILKIMMTIWKRNKSLERTDYYANDKIYETYENAKKAAFSRASLEETMKVEDTEVKFNQFKEYSKKEGKGLASQYAKELQNPKSFKRAMILSEILNKRF